MRLDQLIEELRHAVEYGDLSSECEVTVNMDGNEFTIRISSCGDGVVIILET